MADRLGYIQPGTVNAGLYVNIAWYIGYSLINTPFLFGKRFATPATSLPRAHSPPRPLLDTVLSRSSPRPDETATYYFWIFARHHVSGPLPSLLLSLSMKISREQDLTRKVFKKIILMTLRDIELGKMGVRYRSTTSVHSPLRLREFPFDRVAFPSPREKGPPAWFAWFSRTTASRSRAKLRDAHTSAHALYFVWETKNEW